MKSSLALLTTAQAVEIYSAGQTVRSDSIPQRGKSVGIAKKFGVSPKAIRDIWERRSWVKETRHLWKVTDMPKIRCKQALQTRRAVSSAPQQHCRKSRKDKLPMLERGIEVNTNSCFQPPGAFTPVPRVRSSIPSFAEVARYGAHCSRKSLSLQPPTTSFPHGPPSCAQSLRPASALPPLAASLPPPLAAWVLCSTCDGSCGVCGAARGVARAVGSAIAARDDPFHLDWPHW